MVLEDWPISRISEKSGDGKCKRCGTVISFSEGVADCPRCHGRNEIDLIDIHIQQAEEIRQRRKLGLMFLAVAVIIFGASYVFYAG